MQGGGKQWFLYYANDSYWYVSSREQQGAHGERQWLWFHVPPNHSAHARSISPVGGVGD
jgi:hypothetical protein